MTICFFVNMPDLLWMIGLAFSNEQIMLPVGMIYGFIEGLHRKQWKPIVWFICLLIASAVISEVLKSIFKVPLICDPKRYGFPSGHTQFAAVFYGWICYQFAAHASLYERIISIVLTVSILAFTVRTIVHYGYHTWFDIMGGFVSGGILLFLGAKGMQVLTVSKPKDL